MPSRHHYNQAMRYEVNTRLDKVALEQAIAALLQHHDALRLKLYQTTEGNWVLYQGAPSAEEARIHLPDSKQCTIVDLTGITPEAREAELLAVAETAQRSLSLPKGSSCELWWGFTRNK